MQTHLEDSRLGGRHDSYLDPENIITPGVEAGQTISVVSTRGGAEVHQLTGTSCPASVALKIEHAGLAGGSNHLPQNIDATVPYFKTGYTTLMVTGGYNTQGQHVLTGSETDCFGVGDCLLGGQFLRASGGFRDDADEGAHPYDLQIREDSLVFTGSCTAAAPQEPQISRSHPPPTQEPRATDATSLTQIRPKSSLRTLLMELARTARMRLSFYRNKFSD